MKNKLIVVLGMHRSGTSAMTRGLQVMGVELGDRLMQPARDVNDKGFWEDIDLYALNVEILNTIDSDWYHLAPIEPTNIQTLRKKGLFFRAAELLREKVSRTPIFGFKDPRVAKLLPFWKEVFNYNNFNVGYILVVRHPLSVVRSLAQRDGFEAEQSFLLWLCHIVTSLTNSDSDKRVLVDYDRLMESPERELVRIAKALDLKVDSTELQIYINDFLDKELRHTVYDSRDLQNDETCPPLVREIYTALLDVASDQIKVNNPYLQDLVTQWFNEFDRLKSSLLMIDKLIIQGETVSQALAERDKEIVNLNQALDQREQVIVERDRELVDLNQVLAQRDSEIANLNHVLVERDRDIESLSQALTERKRQTITLENRLSDVYASHSWRLTSFLRWGASQMRRVLTSNYKHFHD